MSDNRNLLLPSKFAEPDELAPADDWYRALLAQTLAGIYVIQDGAFSYVNQEFANIFGYEAPEEIVGKLKISDFIVHEDRALVAENVRKRSEGEVVEMRYAFRGLRLDGRRIDVEVHGRAMEFGGKPAVIGLIHDITERKLAEAASDEKLSALFEHSPVGIALVDATGRHIECNEAYRRLLGKTCEDLRGAPLWSLITERFARESAGLQQALAVNGRYGPVELEYCCGEGRPIAVQTSGVRITGRGGEHYVWSLVEDISERKRLEQETVDQVAALKALNKRLKETRSQLLHAEKMSAVGQLAAGVAHEINNPVGFVKSNLGTLTGYLADLLALIGEYGAALGAGELAEQDTQRLRKRELEVDLDFILEDAPNLLQESLEGIERVRKIVDDLRDFSLVGEVEWQLADIHHCLDSTLNVISGQINQKVEVVKEYGVLPQIRCMPVQLRQVFMNLIVNAAHAIAERGTVWIRTGRENESVWIEVEDNGIGMPPEICNQVFVPFFTTRPVGSGTGLGLAVSYGIVRSHLGDIRVRSAEGLGSVFRVVLPIEPGQVSTEPAEGR